MDQKTYSDTLEALSEDNKVLKEENADLLKQNENLHLANKIRREKGVAKQAYKIAEPFTKVFIEAAKELSAKLTTGEKALMFDLMPLIDWKTNYIVDQSNKRLNMKGIAKQLNMSERNVQRSLESLEKNGVISRNKDGQNITVYVNPKYFYRKAGSPTNENNKTLVSLKNDKNVGK